MKTLFFILCFISTCTCGAQGKWDDTLVGKPIWKVKPLTLEGNNIVYTGKIVLTGYSQDQLFKNALDWYNNNYKSADTRLGVENKEQGTINGTGVIHYEQQVIADGPQNIFLAFPYH